MLSRWNEERGSVAQGLGKCHPLSYQHVEQLPAFKDHFCLGMLIPEFCSDSAVIHNTVNGFERIPASAHKGIALIYREHNGSQPLRTSSRGTYILSKQKPRQTKTGKEALKGPVWEGRMIATGKPREGWSSGSLPTWRWLDFFSQILTSAAINVHSRESPDYMAEEGCVHLWPGHQEHEYSVMTSDAMVKMEVQRTRGARTKDYADRSTWWQVIL